MRVGSFAPYMVGVGLFFFVFCLMMFATRTTSTMDQPIIIIAALAALTLASNVHAITPQELMTKAMRDGKAQGELTGSVADQIRSATRSTAKTLGKFERVEVQADRCEIYTFTITQPQVPDMTGKIVGDYVTTSRSKFCPDNRKDQHQPEIIACSVGGVSCMPGAQVGSPSQK